MVVLLGWVDLIVAVALPGVLVIVGLVAVLVSVVLLITIEMLVYMAKNEIDPADLAMMQLGNMDSGGYASLPEEPAADGPSHSVKAKPKPKPGSGQARKSGGRKYVQMYISREDYRVLKLARTAYGLATGDDIPAGRLAALLARKGLRQVDSRAADIFRDLASKAGI